MKQEIFSRPLFRNSIRRSSVAVAALSLISLFAAQISLAGARFSQVSVSFNNERAFEYAHDAKTNALTLEFKNTTAEEVEKLSKYDEKLVRRATFSTGADKTTTIKYYLRDKNVRVVVSQLKEPFRVTVDFFDKDYRQQVDPNTKIPLNDPIQDHGASLSEPATPKLSEEASNPPPADLETGDKRLLVAPIPEESDSEKSFRALAGLPDGPGKGWLIYPVYMYRLNLAIYEEDEKTRFKSDLKSMETLDAEKLAAFAGSLYNLGHEGKALAAYQKVIAKDASVFDRNAVHLWKLAEIHFGQGNLGLAASYYDSVIEKHPNHILSRHAQIRKVDVEILGAQGKLDAAKKKSLVTNLRAINTRDNQEVATQLIVREAFLQDEEVTSGFAKGKLPKVEEGAKINLEKLLPRVETLRTSFISAALVSSFYTYSETPWSKLSGEFLTDFFSRFRGNIYEPYRENISNAAKKHLSESILANYQKSNFTVVAQIYDDLPVLLKSIRKSPEIAFAIAESYRQIGQRDAAFNLYEFASVSNDPQVRFRSQFHRAVIASEKKNHPLAQKIDQEMGRTWSAMGDDTRNKLSVALKEPMEGLLKSDARLKTPLKIILANYKSGISKNAPKQSASNGQDSNDWAGNFSPSASTVRLISTLGKRFAELGMTPERREALMLLRDIKPSTLQSDKEATREWGKQLTELAEDLRKSNDYLEAGRLYAMVGSEGGAAEGRAEALYKGGLLLFRAGRKDEALEAFRKAKADGNNLFYANLAGERLNQLESQN